MAGWKTLTVAYLAFQKFRDLHPLTHYTGILALHGYARLALAGESPAIMAECHHLLRPFLSGERQVGGNFASYECGGNGTALLLWLGELPEAEVPVRECADELLEQAPRDEMGIFSMPNRSQRNLIWIDAAFAVSPFLVFAGRALEEDRYVEEGVQQIQKLYGVLRDPENGLLHQCKNFVRQGQLSADHWSRGNGWALLALSEVVRVLPPEDPRYASTRDMLVDLAKACLRYQDDDGVWHQELTMPISYVETSGTGLILYALGVGLELEIFDDEVESRYRKGLKGYLDYMRSDGSVYHTCRGCLCPGDGTMLDYMATGPVFNDPHAFGPVTLALAQAHRLGIEEIEPGHGRGDLG